ESGDNRDDFVVELGRGAVVEEIEQGLLGLSPGESREIAFELGDDSRQTVTATVKEIKEKVLPPVDDELAKAATEFETLADLRADIEDRLREQIASEYEAEFRAAVADQLDLQVPDEQVETLIREQGEAVGDDPEPLILGLRENGRFEELRDDLRLRDALDRVAAEVKRIEPEVAAAREAIWTPEKE